MKKYTEDERYMKEAIRQAKKAEAIDDVPIGCVIVCDGKIIARGYNKRNKEKSVLAHAELAAMKKACKKVGDWRLEGCTMYITLEPCQMCAGAISFESPLDGRVQPSGRHHHRCPGRRMFHHALRFLPQTQRTDQGTKKQGQ